MFGEYLVYLDDKPVLMVCDNTVFVKKLPEIEMKMKSAKYGFPYTGAKEHYILDLEDTKLTEEVLTILKKVVPIPAKKVK